MYVALKNAALNLICQYALMAFEMTNKKIFCMLLKDIMHSMQIFLFNKLTTKINKRLVILEIVGNF